MLRGENKVKSYFVGFAQLKYITNIANAKGGPRFPIALIFYPKMSPPQKKIGGGVDPIVLHFSSFWVNISVHAEP